MNKDKWINRRKMAWIAFWASLLFPFLIFFIDIKDIVGPFYLFTGSVVSAYIGFATLDDKWTKNEDN